MKLLIILSACITFSAIAANLTPAETVLLQAFEKETQSKCILSPGFDRELNYNVNCKSEKYESSYHISFDGVVIEGAGVVSSLDGLTAGNCTINGRFTSPTQAKLKRHCVRIQN